MSSNFQKIVLLFSFIVLSMSAPHYRQQQQYYNYNGYPTAQRSYQQQQYYSNYYQKNNNYYGNGYVRPQVQNTWNPLGVQYDEHGNSFIGTKDNGIFLFCNGRGCPGRG